MRAIFCETVEHVEHAAAETAEGEAYIIALTPVAAWACQLRGVPYQRLEDFYDPAQLYAEGGEAFATAVAWAEWLDSFLSRRLPERFGSGRLRPAHASLFLLQIVLNEFYIGSSILRHFFEQARPTSVKHQPWRSEEPLWHLQHTQSVHATLIPQLAPRYGAEVVPFPATEHDVEALTPPQPQPQSRFKALLARWEGSWSWEEVRQLKNFGPRAYVRSLLGQIAPRQRVAMLGGAYDLDALTLALRQRGLGVDYFDVRLTRSGQPAKLDPALAALWPDLLRQDELWKPLEQWGVGRNEHFRSALEVWWRHLVPELLRGYEIAAKRFAGGRYAAAVAWDAGAGTLGGAMLQAARAAAVPTLVYQHGSTARIATELWYFFLHHADCFLTYGEGTARHLRETLPTIVRPKVKLASVGSTRLDALNANVRLEAIQQLRASLRGGDSRPLVLYVPNIFGGYGRELGDLMGYPDVSYFELQQRVLKVFADFPQVRLIYKGFGATNAHKSPVHEFLTREVPNGKVVSGWNLPQLLRAVDAVVLDHAITALGEALLTNKRLVVYDGGHPPRQLEAPEARELLRRRAAVAETADEFVAVVRDLLTSGDFTELEGPNNDFLRAYGTHLDDGRSAERAADEVARMIGRAASARRLERGGDA